MNNSQSNSNATGSENAANNKSTDLAALQKQIENIAEQYVLLELDNLSGLTLLSANLLKLRDAFLTSATLAPADRDQSAPALKAAVRQIDSIIAKTAPDSEKSFIAVGRALLALQGIGRGRGLDPNAFPPELEIQPADRLTASPAPATAPAPVKPPAESSPAMETDDQILKAFLEQELSVLPEIEEKILALEKGNDDAVFAELKRILHTLKGEAGVVGATEISAVCHKMEDYLLTAKQPFATEVLITVNDWLEKSVRTFCDGKRVTGGEAMIEQLARAAKGDSVPPVPAPAPKAVASPVPVKKSENPVPTTSVNILASIDIADKDLAKEFVTEAQEYFDTADENLLILENDPENKEAIGAVFRAFHTIKGIVGFLGLKPIGELAHQAETLLDMVRNGKKPFAGSVVEITFRSLDLLKILVADVNRAIQSGTPFAAQPDLVGILARLQDIIAGREPVESVTAAKNSKESGKKSADAEAEGQPEDKSTTDVSAGIKQAVKIDADRLDLLIDTIGELVIAESMVTQDREIKGLRSLRVEKNLGHLGKITRMLQDMSMSMRMVPIEATFRKMTRLVRDVAKKAEKKVELVMVGKETELDRGMVDKLNDPLVHMIRNSVDHGIESEAERVAAGKPPMGHITLKAFHRGGNIYIEVIDDGKGLDRDRILNKGIERGLVRPGQPISDQEIYALIFEPGFSTAAQVTEISGRGVGMDVVRKNLESLRGNVLIETVKGKGSTFTLVLPLTMAIIDGIMVRVGTETYIIPTLSIIESFRPSKAMLSSVMGRGELIQFRGSLSPLFRLSQLFGVSNAVEDASQATVVVVEDSGKQTALLVDELLGHQQTVIKSLGEAMGAIPGISGASILADGRPGLILDVGGIVRRATSS